MPQLGRREKTFIGVAQQLAQAYVLGVLMCKRIAWLASCKRQASMFHSSFFQTLESLQCSKADFRTLFCTS